MAWSAEQMLFLLLGIFVLPSISAQDLSQTDFQEANAFLDVYFKHKKEFVDDIRIDEIDIKRPKNSRVAAAENMGEFPLHIAILLDASGSQSRRSDELRQFYVDMIESLPLRPNDSVSFIAVNSKIRPVQNATFDKALLLNGFDQVRFSGGTRLNDAIYFISGAFDDQRASRKIIIVLSDGGDNESKKTMEEAYQNAITKNVRIYMFVRDEPGSNLPVWRMKGGVWRKDGGNHEKHIKKTGGKIFSYSHLDSAKEQFVQMMDEWNHLCRISLFVDAPGDGGPDLKISILRNGVKVFHPSVLQRIAGKSR